MPTPKQFTVKPEIRSEVTIGTGGGKDRVLIGRLAETGGNKLVYFDATKEFVALIVGKRGSGKSYALGSLLEGFVTQAPTTDISNVASPRAVLLLDPMGNFWPTAIPVSASGPIKVKAQYDSVRSWRLNPPPLNVRVWLPAGFAEASDNPGIEAFHIDPSVLTDSDWAELLGINLFKDPQGALLADAYEHLTTHGNGDPHYSLDDLLRAVDRVSPQGGPHAPETIRALRRTLGNYARLPLFRGAGTALTDLLRPGQLSVLMLPVRIGRDLRSVLTRILIRRILRDREMAAHISQRLQVEQLTDAAKQQLLAQERERIPRTLVALDEAQELLGDGAGEAREALEDFCLLGRNYGLSLALATQRPTASAISQKVRSQVDTHFIHRLLTQEDIDQSLRNLLTVQPKEIRNGMTPIDLPTLLRQLDVGQALVSSSFMAADPSESCRTFVMDIRPRVAVHGGEVF